MKTRGWKTIRSKALLLQPNRLLQRLYPRALWHLRTTDKILYLTFDDGPIALTEWVLDTLKQFSATATFFCVGDNVLKHPSIYSRVLAEGHLTANHTMHHVKGFKYHVGDYLREVDECQQLVQSNFFRPPYGQLRQSQYQALLKKGYKIVMWDVISYDYENITGEQCLSNVLRNTKPGSIILFHDNIKAEANLKYALPATLKHFQSLGYAFKRLDQI